MQTWFKSGLMLSFTRSAFAAISMTTALIWGAVAVPCADARSHSTPPHVLELFTAQGCTGCPEADLALKALMGRRDLVALTFPVDYWDYLGWKDTFARPEFTQRQAAYKLRFRLRETYSPQLVINGHGEGAGVDPARIESETRKLRRLPARVSLTAHAVRVSGRAPVGGADVWLVRYDPQDLPVQIKAGDNRGKTVTQQNVVKVLVRLGRWKGGSRTYALPTPPDAALKTLVLVQAPRGGDIIGVGPT